MNAVLFTWTIVEFVAHFFLRLSIDLLSSIDKATGSRFNDLIWGDAGNNTLDGAGGNDQLGGGAGEDIFVFGAGAGQDLVQDFSVGAHDVVAIRDHVFADYADVMAHTTQVGADAVIAADAATTLTLHNYLKTSLASYDFLFL